MWKPNVEKNHGWRRAQPIHYMKEYSIDLRRSIRDYNSQTLSHKTRKKGIEYTRYFFCLCVEKVGGMFFIKGSRRTRVRKP